MQRDHERGAGHNREFLASENHGRPALAATSRPGEFHGPRMVPTREDRGPHGRPENHPVARPVGNGHNDRPMPREEMHGNRGPQPDYNAHRNEAPRPGNSRPENAGPRDNGRGHENVASRDNGRGHDNVGPHGNGGPHENAPHQAKEGHADRGHNQRPH